jgi:integration host factor subunit beta
MNKLDLIKKLVKSHDITKQQATKVVEMFFNEMAATLASGGRVEIRGLCMIHVKDYKPFIGRNPKTGEKKMVAAKKLPYFKCGTELKKRMNPK